MTSRTGHLCGLVTALALLAASPALASSHVKRAAQDPSPETRKQMAAVHQQMADCLRSDRPIAECRSEMWKSCHAQMPEGECPMMGPGGRHGMGPGMMGPGPTGGAAPAPETPTK